MSNQSVRSVEQAARGEHRDRAEGERDHRGDRRAEDEQEDDQQDRQRDQLAALGWRRSIRPGSPARGSRSRSGWRAPAAGSFSVEDPVRAPATVSLTASATPTWKSTMIRARRGLGRSRPTEPRSQGESVVTAGSLRAGRGPAPGPGVRARGAGPRRRIANGARVAEVLAQHPVGARGGGSRDVQRGRAEPSVDTGAEDAEDDEDEGKGAASTRRG